MELELILLVKVNAARHKLNTAAKTVNGEVQLHALVDGKKIIIIESIVRRDLQLEDAEGVDCLPNSTIFEQLALIGYEQVPLSSVPSDNFADEAVYKELDDRFENVSKHSNDSLLARGDTLRSDEDRLKLDELMTLCTTLQNRVLDLEKTKTTQHNENASLKRRVKKLEKKNRIDAIDADEEFTLVSVHDINVSAGEEVAEEMVEVINTAKLIIDAAEVSVAGDIVSAASAATTTTATINIVDDITLAQALEEMKSTKPTKKGIVIQELGESTTTISSQLSSQQSQDK
ncbi:hypothetical protein Tco_0539495, partial [Tanacetum coccineum]